MKDYSRTRKLMWEDLSAKSHGLSGVATGDHSAANLIKRNCGSLPAEMRENAGDCNFVGHAHNFVNINE